MPSSDLKELGIQRFRKLSEAETRLLYCAPTGKPAICGPTPHTDELANDPAHSDSWGSERVIRAELIRWLCVDQAASNAVDRRGIQILAAKITGKLDLSYATISFPLRLEQCRLTDDALLKGIKIPELILNGSHTRCLMAEEAEVKGNLLLQRGFTADGQVRLIAAQIGNLNCEGSSFSNSRGCSDSAENQHLGQAILADRMKVEGGVFFNKGFKADGEVMLSGARIGGDLSCRGGTFGQPNTDAISAENAKVEGNVFLDRGFHASGLVDLFNTQVGGSVNCSGGTFDYFVLRTAIVKGEFIWINAHSEYCLDLRLASVGTITDDKSAWPDRGHLLLDGFVYERILSGPSDALARLDWLNRQPEFRPQPYRQLARVLADMGDNDGAKEVLFEMESRARAADRRRLILPMRLWDLTKDVTLRETVGYGVYPLKAFWSLAVLWLTGWVFFRRASMAPTDKEAYAKFRENGSLPDHYPRFNGKIYSLENCVPFLKLGQNERWQPDPNPQRRVISAVPKGRWWTWTRLKKLLRFEHQAPSTRALQWVRWIIIVLGWMLATFFVAGLSGIIRTH